MFSSSKLVLVNKLFNELRSYEKVQLMSYLYLFNAQKGFLVEALKKKDSTDINIIECLFDNEYMQTILSDVKRFIEITHKSFPNVQVLVSGSLWKGKKLKLYKNIQYLFSLSDVKSVIYNNIA